MLEIFKKLVPDSYQKENSLFIYYLKTLKDKEYKINLPDLSIYQVQILKQKNSFTVVIHKHYKSEVCTISLTSIERMLKDENKKPVQSEEINFINDLRF